jgi:hypothetical protein
VPTAMTSSARLSMISAGIRSDSQPFLIAVTDDRTSRPAPLPERRERPSAVVMRRPEHRLPVALHADDRDAVLGCFVQRSTSGPA